MFGVLRIAFLDRGENCSKYPVASRGGTVFILIGMPFRTSPPIRLRPSNVSKCGIFGFNCRYTISFAFLENVFW